MFMLRLCVTSAYCLILVIGCSGKSGKGIRAPVSGSSGSEQPDSATAAAIGGVGGARAAGTGGAGRAAVGGRGGAAAAASGGGGGGGGDIDVSAVDAGSTSATPVQSLVCPSGMSFGDPLPSNRTAALVKKGFGFLEGPVWITKSSVLLFSDMNFNTSNNPNGPDSMIRRLMLPDQIDVLVPKSGSNGLALAVDGDVIAATHDVQSLSKFDPQSGARETLDLSYQGKHFNSPNDLAVRSDGNIYFSDPDWQLGPRSSETGMTGLYRVAPNGTVSLVDGSLDKPNGVAISPDERTLYAGSNGNDILSYALDEAGAPGAGKKFATTGSSDGMSIDCAGNLYVVSDTIEVFASSGTKLGDINVAETPSNVAFGGPQHKTLFITAQTGLYKIELNVPGRAY
jgi:gluconolactonase